MSFMICCIPGCFVKYGEGIPLHRFPNPVKEEERFRKWFTNCKVAEEIANQEIFKNRRVCHKHFEAIYHGSKNRISNIAVPTLHLSDAVSSGASLPSASCIQISSLTQREQGEEAKKWKHTFAKEIKKKLKPRSGPDTTSEPVYKDTWPYFEATSSLKIILKPQKTDSNILTEDNSYTTSPIYSEPTLASPENCNTPPENRVEVNQEPEIEPSEPFTVLTEPDINLPSTSLIPARIKRKKRDDALEAFLEIDKEQLKILSEDQRDSKDEDLLWFKSILPYMKQLPPLKKLQFRTEMQDVLLTELSKLSTTQDLQTDLKPKRLNI